MHFMKSTTPNSTEKNIRIHHHRLDKEYSILPNHGAENDKLSWAAKGLLWYMISRQSTFEIHSWHLASLHKGTKRGGGIAGIRVMLDELKKEGYLVHHKYQNKQGHWEHRYDLYPIPAEDFQKMFPDRVKPYVAEPSTVKHDVLPITELPITEQHVLFVKESSPVAPPPVKNNTKKNTQGKQMPITKEDLYAQCVLNKKDWVKEEIEEAWKILEEYPSPVTNWFKFCEGTIKNLRRDRKIKQIDKKKPCQKFQNSSPSKEPSSNTNEKTSETDTVGHHLVNWRQQVPLVKKSSNS